MMDRTRCPMCGAVCHHADTECEACGEKFKPPRPQNDISAEAKFDLMLGLVLIVGFSLAVGVLILILGIVGQVF